MNHQGWNVVVDPDEARRFIQERGCPNRISFCHDMTKRGDGLAFTKWFISGVLDGTIKVPTGFTWQVNGHTYGTLLVQETLQSFDELVALGWSCSSS